MRATGYPAVSVIMPILNEEKHLAEAVSGVLAQDYPGRMQVVLALGPSRDATARIAAELAADDDRVLVVDNPSGRTPEGLNRALDAAAHDIIVRVDGHGVLCPGYVTTAVDLLEETGAANVGGIMHAQGTTPTERTIATAMRSPLGVGGARFHVGGEAGPAETVYLGVFRREWLDRVGGYDESFTRAQDWEMNYRIRTAGGTVWFSPDLKVTYRPRSSLKALAKQYRDYGRWRRVVARTHKGSINLRYLAAPATLLACAAGAVGGFFWRPLWALPAGYASLVTAGGLWVGRDDKDVAVRMPAVLATMHMSWGWGFLTSNEDVEVADPDA